MKSAPLIVSLQPKVPEFIWTGGGNSFIGLEGVSKLMSAAVFECWGESSVKKICCLLIELVLGCPAASEGSSSLV